jgi:mRNA interferase MazF
MKVNVMNRYKKSEIWLGKINGKDRPLLIIGKDIAAEVDKTVLTITSQKARNKYDVIVEKWKEAGLDKPSIVRCSKINAIFYFDLKFRIGSLQENDFNSAMEAVRTYLG